LDFKTSQQALFFEIGQLLVNGAIYLATFADFKLVFRVLIARPSQQIVDDVAHLLSG
jgi:hypothetical protein